MINFRVRAFWLTPLLLLSLGPASRAESPAGRVKMLSDAGKWLEARQLAEELLKKNPKDRKLEAQLKAVDEKAKKAAESPEFDPKIYFYAQAYLDYYEKGRFARAMDSMDQVLALEEGNEEVKDFQERAQARVAEAMLAIDVGPTALQATGLRGAVEPPSSEGLSETGLRGALETPSGEGLVETGRGLSGKVLSPSDPEWPESTYREALKAYVRKDHPKAVDLMRQLLAREPDNERWKKSLQRIEKELPQ